MKKFIRFFKERAFATGLFAVLVLAAGFLVGPRLGTAFNVPPPDAQPTGNSMFPYTVPSVLGRNFVNKPLPTGYPAPLGKFVGRYFDGYPHGNWTTSMGFYWRFLAGGEPVKSAGNRVYMRLGSTIAAYNKSTFINRLGTEPMAFFRGTYSRGYTDGVLPWDAYFYPEEGTTNGWLQEACDCNANLHSFDVDDRGYLYLAHLFGVGIIRDPNFNSVVVRREGNSLQPVSQIRGIKGLTFADGPKTLPFTRVGSHGSNKITDAGAGDTVGNSNKVIVLKSSGQYYLAVQENTVTHIINVTDPLNPQYQRAEPDSKFTVQSSAIVGAGDRNSIRLYNVADYVSGGAYKEFSADGGKYFGLAADRTGGKFYALHYSTAGARAIPVTLSISVFSPGIGGADNYTEVRYPLDPASVGGVTSSAIDARFLEYSNGYLTAISNPHSGSAWDFRVWYFKDGKPVELNTRDFLNSYYGTSGYPTNISSQSIGGKDYLFVSTYEIADVYELAPTGKDGSTLPPPPPGSPTSTTPSTINPVLGGAKCLERYQYLCDQFRQLTRSICALAPSFCKAEEVQQ